MKIIGLQFGDNGVVDAKCFSNEFDNTIANNMQNSF